MRIFILLLALTCALADSSSDALESTIVSLVNSARANPDVTPANPLPLVSWNTTLANDAQTYASKCRYMHSPYYAATLRGETIFRFQTPVTNVSASAETAFNAWYRQGEYYDWVYESCKFKSCKDYKQVMWVNTTQVGCGISTCGAGNSSLLVCFWTKFGGYKGLHPFVPNPSSFGSTPAEKAQYSAIIRANATAAYFADKQGESSSNNKRNNAPLTAEELRDTLPKQWTPVSHTTQHVPTRFLTPKEEEVRGTHARSADGVEQSGNTMTFYSGTSQTGNSYAYSNWNVGDCINTPTFASLSSSLHSLSYASDPSMPAPVIRVRVYDQANCAGNTADFTQQSPITDFGSWDNKVVSVQMLDRRTIVGASLSLHSGTNQQGNSFGQGWDTNQCSPLSTWGGISGQLQSMMWTPNVARVVNRVLVWTSNDCSGQATSFDPGNIGSDGWYRINSFGALNNKVYSWMFQQDVPFYASINLYWDINFGGSLNKIYATQGTDTTHCYDLGTWNQGSSFYVQPGFGIGGLRVYLQNNCQGGYTDFTQQSVPWVGGAVNDQILSFQVLAGGDAASFDWTQYPGLVTPVKNQGGCGDCWAFSATETIEGAIGLKYGHCDPLSPQQTTDCSGAGSCNGGWSAGALTYYATVGIASNATIPFVSGDGKDRPCSYDFYNSNDQYMGLNPVLKIVGSSGQTFDAFYQSLKVYGPQSITVYVGNNWSPGSNGYISQASAGQTNHQVLLVGYDSSQNAWKIKNQWDTWWGDAGYAFLDASTNGCSDCYDNPLFYGVSN